VKVRNGVLLRSNGWPVFELQLMWCRHKSKQQLLLGQQQWCRRLLFDLSIFGQPSSMPYINSAIIIKNKKKNKNKNPILYKMGYYNYVLKRYRSGAAIWPSPRFHKAVFSFL
jgi:hypothetical protein